MPGMLHTFTAPLDLNVTEIIFIKCSQAGVESVVCGTEISEPVSFNGLVTCCTPKYNCSKIILSCPGDIFPEPD